MKPTIIISCPATSRSGYGDHTRDLIRSLIELDKFDIKIFDQRWGTCSRDALTTNDTDLTSRLVQPPFQNQPDIWIQVTVPNEFTPMGKYNIGITAGMETTMVSSEWIEGINRMDLNIVPSEHSKETFIKTVYDKIDNRTKQKTGSLQCTKPIEVLFEGLDQKVYHKTSDIPVSLNDELSQIKEKFCFLFVGHWLKGSFGHDRKDVGGLIRTFIETFKNNPTSTRPALILKSSGADFSVIDREEMLKKIRYTFDSSGIKNPPKVYLLHGDLKPQEVNGLYNHPKVKAMVSFTKGEGFGRPLLEFGVTGKPIIASNWSGQKDFLHPDNNILLPGELKDVHESAVWEKVILKEAKWFYVDFSTASAVMKDVFKNYKKHCSKSSGQPSYIKKNFTLEKMTEKFGEILDNNLPKFSEKVEMNLPKLKLPKLEKVNG